MKKLNLLLVGAVVVGLGWLKLGQRLDQGQWMTVRGLMTSGNILNDSSKLPSGWLVDSIKVGDADVDLGGRKTAEVVAIESYEEGPNKVAVLTLKLKTTNEARTGRNRYRQKVLEVGSDLNLVLNQSKVTVTIVALGKEAEAKNEYRKVGLKLYWRKPWWADQVKLGDKKEDASGLQVEVLGKHETLADVDEAMAVGAGISKNPKLRDLDLTVRLRVEVRNGLPFFAHFQPVKAGNKLFIPMKDYNLYDAEVTDVKVGN